jgi:hypothetical protein
MRYSLLQLSAILGLCTTGKSVPLVGLDHVSTRLYKRSAEALGIRYLEFF